MSDGDSKASAPSAYDEARAGWGFPRFARDFPRHDALDALVVAFARGDYHAVRDGAPRLARETEDEAVKSAARRLVVALEPDPIVKTLFVLTASLLAFLTIWWLTHDKPPAHDGPQPTPTVEIVK